ncbi:MAG: hypothetical protein ABFC94_14690 [Syntrophomonas sp.]
MKWTKRSLIYCPTSENDWRNNSALQPTPILINDNIRVYAGFRDINGISRIGYVELDKSNPRNVLSVSESPVLDVGDDGMFDENGVVPTSIVKRGSDVFLYYAGYSLGKKVRFQVFTGLAISKDNGDSFQRVKKIPVTDRVENEELFRVIHSIIFVDGVWKVYYGAGNHFVEGKKKTLPVYDIRYMESADGINFPNRGIVSVPIPTGCHRVGRPYVFFEEHKFKLYYGFGSEKIPYQLAYLESVDGIKWNQKDINLPLSESGWDSQMMAYPSFMRVDNKGYLFYNGNNYGFEGFGFAELIEE